MENKPQLVIIAGPNGAGKSTVSNHYIFRNIYTVNPDVIAKEQSLSVIDAGKIAIEQRTDLLKQKESFAIETTLTGNSEIKLMQEAKEQGYKINLVYVGIDDASLSNNRVKERVLKGGHDVPKEDIFRRYDRSINNLPKALEIADRVYIFDNSYKNRLLLCTKKNNIIKTSNNVELPKWFLHTKITDDIKKFNVQAKNLESISNQKNIVKPKFLTFDDYKARVSIIRIAESLGYQFDPKDGNVSPVYKLYDANGYKQHEIVIKNPNNNTMQYYFDRNNKKGDLISFIKNNIDKFPQFYDPNQYKHINNILAYYSGTEHLQQQNRQHDTFRIAEKFDAAKFTTVQSTVKDFHYLRDNRKISENTINTFLPFIKRIKEIETADKPKTFINIAFPYNKPGKNEIVNFEMRNYNFKGFPENGNKKDAVWIANFASSAGNEVKNIYIAESAIDAMSFYELNKDNINLSQSIFCSTGGNLIDTQLLNLKSAFPSADIIGCYDNDLAGNIYDIRTYCLLNDINLKITNENDSENVKFEISGGEFSIKKENVNLNTFCKKSGKKTAENYKIAKPSDGFKDFNDQLKKNFAIKISSKNTDKSK